MNRLIKSINSCLNMFW